MKSKSFKMTATIDVPAWIDNVSIPGIEYLEQCDLEVPVTVRVCDGEGACDSQICVVNPEDMMKICDGDNEVPMKIGEFMGKVNIDTWKMADICMNEEVISQAQHQWIYGDKSLIVQ